MLPETHANTPSVATIIADDPAAKPSIPSVKLAPFEIAVTIKTTININRTQAYLAGVSPIQLTKLL